jgi:hypothetical protein
VILPVVLLLAQLELAGGASSLFNAGGGSVTLHRPEDSTTVTAGVVGGRLVGGMQFRTGNWIVGDEQLILTTGVEGTAVALRGVAYELSPNLTRTCPEPPARRLYGVGSCRPRRYDLLIAVGLTGDAYTLPFFAGMRATKPTAGLRFSTPLGTSGTFALVALAGKEYSLVPELDLKRRFVDLSLSAGRVQGRTLVDSRFALRSSHTAVVAAHTTFLAPFRLNLDSLGGSVSVRSVSAYASVFRSRFSGEAFGASWRLSWIQASASYLLYHPSRSISLSLSEQLTRRIGVGEYLTRSGGRNTYNAGGSFRSNLATLSLTWQEYFVPGEGFKSLPTASVALQLPRSITLNLSMVGQLWTSYGSSFVGGPVGSSASIFSPRLSPYQPVEEN